MPIPVIQLDYARPEPRRPRRLWAMFCVVAIPITWLTCATAWVLIYFMTVESVLATGPVLLATGIMVVIAGAMGKLPSCIAVGAAHCAVCLLFFGLVVLYSWSPGQATQPFAVMGALYTGLVAPGCMIAWRRAWRAWCWGSAGASRAVLVPGSPRG